LAARGQVFNASDLFSASDGDGDALLYFFYDNSANPGSGYFTVNGVGLHPVPRTPSSGVILEPEVVYGTQTLCTRVQA
jgi:hypothetical protein